MTPAEQHAIDVLHAAAMGDWQDMLYWTAADGQAPKPHVIASDWFAPCGGDGEEIEPGELPALLACIRETMGPERMESLYGPLLWAGRKCKLAPHALSLKGIPERLRPLFAECGQ